MTIATTQQAKPDPEQAELSDRIQDVLVGSDFETALSSLIECMAAVLCMCCTDIEIARAFADETPKDIRASIDLNWQNAREQRRARLS